jgi:hypothetical protein
MMLVQHSVLYCHKKSTGYVTIDKQSEQNMKTTTTATTTTTTITTTTAVAATTTSTTTTTITTTTTVNVTGQYEYPGFNN